MKPLIFKSFAFILFIVYTITGADGQPPAKDRYGRIIKDESGKRINYYKEDLLKVSTLDQFSSNELNSTSSSTASNCKKDTADAQYYNLITVMSSSIGRNSMHSADLDGDGKMELICSASTSTFGSGNYWYIMQYDAANDNYHQIWVSPIYDAGIKTIETADLDGDNRDEILLGLDDGTIQVFNGTLRTLQKQAMPVSRGINSITFADADNDSSKEIVISCENNTYLLDPETLRIGQTINKGADHVLVGNVDDDPNNEIILSSGWVLRLTNSNLTEIWNYNSSGGDGMISLYDIDNDLKDEIIFAKAWYNIYIYDADSETTKFSIKSDLDIDALLVQDINNDGTAEILYGDGQWGEIHCYSSKNQTELWKVNNPEHGVTAINYSDIDNDGNKELIWGAGWTSTGSDYLYIYDQPNGKLKWRSDDVRGPFYAIATGDADNDGNDEIVCVSYESESGYASGIIFIFDAKSHKLEWQSTGDFLYQVWTGIYDVAIDDIDQDGNNEIIIAAGQTYTGEIWIIDGKNHTIKSSHIFGTEELNEFYGLEISDIDNDGKKEIIAATTDVLAVINPDDWSVKWKVDIPGTYTKPILNVGDVNGDNKKEIILCKGSLMIINSTDHSLWTSTASDFNNIDLYDYNKDDTIDIAACTDDGYIKVFNGASHAVISEIKPENTSINSVRLLQQNDSVYFIYSCEGRLNIFQNNSNCLVTQKFGDKAGSWENLKLYKRQDTDSVKILVGTSISVLELSGNLMSCMDFNVNLIKSEPACNQDDGTLKVNITGGIAPYIINWNNNSSKDSLTNLSPGYYQVIVKDNGACIKQKAINLTRAYIEAKMKVKNEGCKENGSIDIELNHIAEPYTIEWSNNATGLLNEDLLAGKYSVKITDAKNCKFEDTVQIREDSVSLYAISHPVSCNGYADGRIDLYIESGEPPFTYDWGKLSFGASAYNLKSGTYNVKVTDDLGCSDTVHIKISQPDKITYNILTSPDIAETSYWDGKIMINDISGGNPPYQVYWPRLSRFGDYQEALTEGNYEFVITDSRGCQLSDTAVIMMTPTAISQKESDQFLVYPNPANHILFVKVKNTGMQVMTIEVINQDGRIVQKSEEKTGVLNTLNVDKLQSGLYLIKVNVNHKVYTRKILID